MKVSFCTLDCTHTNWRICLSFWRMVWDTSSHTFLKATFESRSMSLLQWRVAEIFQKDEETHSSSLRSIYVPNTAPVFLKSDLCGLIVHCSLFRSHRFVLNQKRMDSDLAVITSPCRDLAASSGRAVQFGRGNGADILRDMVRRHASFASQRWWQCSRGNCRQSIWIQKLSRTSLREEEGENRSLVPILCLAVCFHHYIILSTARTPWRQNIHDQQNAILKKDIQQLITECSKCKQNKHMKLWHHRISAKVHRNSRYVEELNFGTQRCLKKQTVSIESSRRFCWHSTAFDAKSFGTTEKTGQHWPSTRRICYEEYWGKSCPFGSSKYTCNWRNRLQCTSESCGLFFLDSKNALRSKTINTQIQMFISLIGLVIGRNKGLFIKCNGDHYGQRRWKRLTGF